MGWHSARAPGQGAAFIHGKQGVVRTPLADLTPPSVREGISVVRLDPFLINLEMFFPVSLDAPRAESTPPRDSWDGVVSSIAAIS
jgi:hypothetical protein